MSDSELDVKYVPEVATDTGEAFARALGQWVPAVAKAAMEAFVAEVKAQASSAASSAASADSAAKATATNAAQTAQAVVDARAAVDSATAQVVLAQTAVTKALAHATTSEESAKQADASAVRAEAQYEAAKKVVEDFNPWINQYGYSKVVTVNDAIYRVTEADVGKTLLFTRTARVVLPATARVAFPESFFFHITTLDPSHQVYVDYDLACVLSKPLGAMQLIVGATRATVQLLVAGHWRLYEYPSIGMGGLYDYQTELTIPGQSRGITSVREALGGAYRFGLTKQYGNFYAWSAELLGGKLSSATADASRASILPDGALELAYAANGTFNGAVLFGVYGAAKAPANHFGWYWGSNGFAGNLYRVVIEGYSPTDWVIEVFEGDFAGATKHAWLKMASRHLVDSLGRPVAKWLLVTSTDGYNWFENRFLTANTQIGTRAIVAHFPITVLDTGELYLLESDGSVKRAVYDFTRSVWTETVVCDGHDRVVQCKWWSGGDYALVTYDSGQLHFFTRSSTLAKTVENHTITQVSSVVSYAGDAARSATVVYRAAGTVVATKAELLINAANPNGVLTKTNTNLNSNATDAELLLAGTTVINSETTSYQVYRSLVAGRVYCESQTVGARAVNFLNWYESKPLALGNLLKGTTNYGLAIATDLGLFGGLDD